MSCLRRNSGAAQPTGAGHFAAASQDAEVNLDVGSVHSSLSTFASQQLAVWNNASPTIAPSLFFLLPRPPRPPLQPLLLAPPDLSPDDLSIPTLHRTATSSPPSYAPPQIITAILTCSQWPGPTASVHPPSPAPPARSRLRRFVGFSTVAILAFSAGLIYEIRTDLNRMTAGAMATDAETLAYRPDDAIAQEIDERLRTHPEAIKLRENPDFKEVRPHLKLPEQLRARMLTAGTLSGPNKIVVPPYVFSEEGGKSMISFMYLGSDVCGHPGIIHGGLLATLLDEGFARCCFPAMPNKVGVTANLNIDYRAPAMADSYFVLRAETVKQEGRKAWVEGRIETLPQDGSDPVVLVEAKALFIEPRQAASLAHLYRGATE
ncbi:Thioesterase/thiol ester dehydrase-isomerase [Penicillium argentinense]|uniref:Thioesterase/thiol ester dehydrase-isomerase n=1 Tax=Penicillium argentinense TaxID=1131581 RepID=A0A9W9KA97_9EURO|nr:Thioesterase/thiol ester dehydrase-isomerase [Penicillium argentinense]KAJ5098790.1 Thioesterase/thiol ester dehydrase-isomerase [Penicillium argentinense]